MQSIALQGLFPLLHLFLVATMTEGAPPFVFISLSDYLNRSLVSQAAQFGSNFQDVTYAQPYLMLPPNEPTLCDFPSSLANMTKTEAQGLTLEREIALLIDRGECNFDQKAQVIVDIQRQLIPSLKYMIVRSLNSSEKELIIMSSNRTDNQLTSVGAMFLSWKEGTQLLDVVKLYSEIQNISSKLLSKDMINWNLQVTLQAAPSRDTSDPSDANSSGSSDALYSLRFVLFALLILSPCIRAGYLWYSAGGRILVRRDENGRFTGLQYVRPLPNWLATSSEVNRDDKVTLLTEEQVTALPELVFKGKPFEGDETIIDGDDTVKTSESFDSKVESFNDKKQNDQSPNEFCSLEQNTGNHCTPLFAGTEKVQDLLQPEVYTTCTMCSICIDEFEDGETIRVLPKCHHGFHFDCIKPWLTERQSCCPLCKTNVLTDDASNSGSTNTEDSPA